MDKLSKSQLDLIEQHYDDFSSTDQDQAKQILFQQRPDSNLLMRIHQQEHPPAAMPSSMEHPLSDVFNAIMGRHQQQGPQLPTDPFAQMQQMGIMRRDDNPPLNDALLGLATTAIGAGGAEGENYPALGKAGRKAAGKGSDILEFVRHPLNSAIKMGLDQIKEQQAAVAPTKTYSAPPLGKFHGGQEQASMTAPPVTFPPQQGPMAAPPVTFKPPLEGPTEVSPHPAPPVRFKKPAAEVRPNYPAPPVTFKSPAEADNTDIAETLGLSPPKQPDDIYHQQANAKIDPMDAVVKDRNIAGYLKREGYTKEKYDSLTLAQKKDLIKQVPFHNKQPYRWSDDLEARAPQTIRALLPDK